MSSSNKEVKEQPVKEELDLSALRNAVLFYYKAIKVYGELIEGDTTAGHRELLRFGLIKIFGTNYDLCWKTMKRWLETNISPDEVFGVNRREFYRICAENSLIDDVNQWMEFHQARNRAQHTYNETVAQEVLAAALKFLPYAQDCLARLEKRS